MQRAHERDTVAHRDYTSNGSVQVMLFSDRLEVWNPGGLPLSKSAISTALGQKEISGHLNQVIRVLLNDQTLEYTLPDKPNSRLQQYRLTEKGRLLLGVLRKVNPP